MVRKASPSSARPVAAAAIPAAPADALRASVPGRLLRQPARTGSAAAGFIPGGVAPPGAIVQRNVVPMPEALEERRRAQEATERAREVAGIVVCLGGAIAPTLDIEHHWIERGGESYGWWPSRMPAGDSDAAWAGTAGVPGILNGTTLGRGGTATRDPHHGHPARRYPVYTVSTPGRTGGSGGSAATVIAAIRTFARGYRGNYSWTPTGTDCHEFVEDALSAAGVARSRRLLPAAPP